MTHQKEFYCENNLFSNPQCEEILKNRKNEVPVFIDIYDENHVEVLNEYGWKNVDYKWFCSSCANKSAKNKTAI